MTPEQLMDLYQRGLIDAQSFHRHIATLVPPGTILKKPPQQTRPDPRVAPPSQKPQQPPWIESTADLLRRKMYERQLLDLEQRIQQVTRTTPYTDPLPDAASSPPCPQCNKLLIQSDAEWSPNRHYWTCPMHGQWRLLDSKVIPPHPNDSGNCGHWIKDGMLWIWERQQWECLECRRTQSVEE